MSLVSPIALILTPCWAHVSEQKKKIQNCDKPLFMKYHDEVTALNTHPTTRRRIFTYVDHDDFMDSRKVDEAVVTSSHQPSFLTERMAKVRSRHGARQSAAASRAISRFPVTTELSERDKARRVVDTPCVLRRFTHSPPTACAISAC